MKLDFGQLAEVKEAETHPNKLFKSLPFNKYPYPRDVQAEVWNKWNEQREQKNNVIKMNTGAGKTVVALLILRSLMNQSKGNAVYVVPDSYLIEQVIEEAENLGIKVCRDDKDLAFQMKEAILVINIHKLVNGKSIFGMRTDNNVQIDNIVIDDVHACLNTIETQFTIRICRKENPDQYQSLLALFEQSLMTQSESTLEDIRDGNPGQSLLVPFWSWQDKQPEVRKILDSDKEKEIYKFNYPLIKEILKFARCFVAGNEIQIIPFCLPIDRITSFVNAKRRIFLSATLSDDTVFSSVLNIPPSQLGEIITPEYAGDIGERMIVYPSALSPGITDEEIRKQVGELAKKMNVLIIVPSHAKAEKWKSYGNVIANDDKMKEKIDSISKSKAGLYVIVNKYDGIDLPDDACRLLVIDSLPPLHNQYDKFEQTALPSNKRMVNKYVQKIEQGMGRGVRSNQDYCGIIFMGNSLIETIFAKDGYRFFSEATKRQIELSKQVWEMMGSQPRDKVFDVLDYLFNRDDSWVKASKSRLKDVKNSSLAKFDSFSVAVRDAFEQAQANVRAAERRLREYLDTLGNDENEKQLRGFVKQLLAEYINFYSPTDAQQMLLSAAHDNRRLTKCLQGIEYTKILYKDQFQAQRLKAYCDENNIDANKYIMKIHALLDELIFGASHKVFENALNELASLLGYIGTRPDAEYGKGPDNFWAGKGTYFVIECKNEAVAERISKKYCSQVGEQIQWFENNYKDMLSKMTPILVHYSKEFDVACSPNDSIRIMTPGKLRELRESLKKFSAGLSVDNTFNDITKIQQSLVSFNLTSDKFVSAYTEKFTQAKS